MLYKENVGSAYRLLVCVVVEVVLIAVVVAVVVCSSFHAASSDRKIPTSHELARSGSGRRLLGYGPTVS